MTTNLNSISSNDIQSLLHGLVTFAYHKTLVKWRNKCEGSIALRTDKLTLQDVAVEFLEVIKELER